MKKLMVGLMVLGLASAVSAALITTDDFSSSGALTANGWEAYSGADASITSDGSVASVGSGAEDIRLVFADQGAGATYASFILNISTLPSSGSEYSFGFIDGSTMDARWGIVSESSGTAFGIGSWGGGTTLLNTFSGLSLNTDYMITMYNDGSTDHRLWVDSHGTDFASADLPANNDAAGGIDGIFIRQAGALDNGAADWTVDDVVVATTFAEVIPEPTTLALLGVALGMLAIVRRRRIA